MLLLHRGVVVRPFLAQRHGLGLRQLLATSSSSAPTPTPTSSSSKTARENARLQQWLREGRTAEVVQAVQSHGWTPDTFSFGLAMRAAAKMADYEQCGQLLGRAETKHGIVPSDYMWSAWLEACRHARRLDQAVAVAEQMKARGVGLYPFALASLMDAHGRAGDWQGALRLFEEHKAQPLDERNRTILYTTAITALGRGRQWRRALELLYTDMARDGVSADVVTYGALMHACGRAKQWGEVNRLFQHMTQHAGLAPNQIVCHSVLKAHAWGTRAQLPGAMALLRAMENGTYAHVRPNAETYHIVLALLAKFREATEARALYDSLPAASAKHAGDVLLAYANAENGPAALAFLVHLRKNGPAPDGLCFSHAVLACGRSGLVDDARALLDEMRSRGMLGRSRSAGVVETFSKEEAWEEAASLSAAITETFSSSPELTPGPTAFNASLSVFCCVGDWSGGVALLRQMAKHAVEVNQKNGAVLLDTVAKAGQWPVAVFLLEEWVLLQRHRIMASGFAGLADGLPDDVLAAFGPALYRHVHARGVVSHRHQEEGVVDFHGFGSRASVCAILALLQDMASSEVKTTALPALVMVVGRGKHSGRKYSGVLGPYLKRALATPALFTPTLAAHDLPNNPGRLVLPQSEVAKYVKAMRLSRGHE